MGDFTTRLDEGQLTDVDRLLIHALLNSVRAAERTATTNERPIPPEWQVVIVRADDVEQA